MLNLICSKCEKSFKSKAGFTNHNRRCDGSGFSKSIRKRKSYEIKCDKCGFSLKVGFFKRHYPVCKGTGPRKKHDKITSKELSKRISDGLKLRHKNDPTLGKRTGAKIKGNPNIGKALDPFKEIIRKKKISETMKRNPFAGGYREGSGKGKKSTYISSIAGIVKLDSNFEVEFAIELDRLKINWKRNTTRFYFNWNGIRTYYIPDFYLIDKDLYVETKGFWYKDKKEKTLEAVKINNINLQIIMQKDWIINKEIFL